MRLAGSEQLTDVVFVGDLAAERTADGRVDVAVRTVRPLDERATTVLVERRNVRVAPSAALARQPAARAGVRRRRGCATGRRAGGG